MKLPASGEWCPRPASGYELPLASSSFAVGFLLGVQDSHFKAGRVFKCLSWCSTVLGGLSRPSCLPVPLWVQAGISDEDKLHLELDPWHVSLTAVGT